MLLNHRLIVALCMGDNSSFTGLSASGIFSSPLPPPSAPNYQRRNHVVLTSGSCHDVAQTSIKLFTRGVSDKSEPH